MNRLRVLREDSDKSQAQIASALGVHPSTVGGWESEARQMDYATLIKVADYFDVSIDYLLGHEYKTINVNDIEKEMLGMFRSLSKKQKNLVFGIIELIRQNT